MGGARYFVSYQLSIVLVLFFFLCCASQLCVSARGVFISAPESSPLRQHGESEREKENKRGHGARRTVSSSPLLHINNLSARRGPDAETPSKRLARVRRGNPSKSEMKIAARKRVYAIYSAIVLLSLGFHWGALKQLLVSDWMSGKWE